MQRILFSPKGSKKPWSFKEEPRLGPLYDFKWFWFPGRTRIRERQRQDYSTSQSANS